MLGRIVEHGLSPRRKLLLTGPPGTGKTMTASVLAGELGLPLFQVRLDGLITKFMGETAAKLRQIFDATSRTRGVYFFDEFDAIGSQRGIPNDVGEIRRVLNSFLQMIEQDRSHSLVVAATNHPTILDSALFRRFDDILHYELPDEATGHQAPEGSSLGLRRKERPGGGVWLILAAGLSYAEITRACNETLKDALIHDRSAGAGDGYPDDARGAQERRREARVKRRATQGTRTPMAEERDGLRRHFILDGVTETEPYRYVGSSGGGPSEIPARNRARHGAELQRQIGVLRGVGENAREAQQATGMEDGLGLQVEFESFPEHRTRLRDAWHGSDSGIELLNVRHEGNRTRATVFVPDGKLDHFERLIREYLEKARDKAGRRRDNQRLIDAIQEIRAASLRALWTDSTDVFPTPDDGAVWWEVWLPVRRDRNATVAAFRERAEAQGMEVAHRES